MTVNRKKLRDLSFKIVFSYDFYPHPELEEETKLFLEQQEELTEEDREEILGRSLEIFRKIGELDREISEKTEGWRIERFSRVDLSIIRLALYEMHYDPETPKKVAVNEAVELAKVYGGDDSPKFVNGVLAKLIGEVREDTESDGEPHDL